MKRWALVLLIILSIAIALLLILFFVRLFSERQIDDISPGIPCSQDLLEKADAYYVIPKFDNISILEDKAWIEKIKSMNKDLRLHGVRHTYNEFGEDRDSAYLQEGVMIFEGAFGKKPERFKAPQLNITEDNKKLVWDSGMKVDEFWNQLLHKVYHCNDTGMFSNRFLDWF